ncbi:unnamed protein product, partial [Rotaria sp. Silwood1]
APKTQDAFLTCLYPATNTLPWRQTIKRISSISSIL